MNETTAIVQVSVGAILGEHEFCGGAILVDSCITQTEARCERCGKRYTVRLIAELEAV